MEARVDGMMFTITLDDGRGLAAELDITNPSLFLDQMAALGLDRESRS